MAAGAKQGSNRPSLWCGANPGKRWTEALFLAYSPFWIAWALCIVVPLRLYEACNSLPPCRARGQLVPLAITVAARVGLLLRCCRFYRPAAAAACFVPVA